MCVCVVGWGDRIRSSGKEAVPQSVGSCFYGPIPSSKRQTVYYLGGWGLQQCSWPSFGYGQHTLSPCLWEDFPQSPGLFSLPKPSAFCLVSCSCHTILTYWDRGCFLLWFCRSLQQAQGEPIPFMAPEEKQPLLDLFLPGDMYSSYDVNAHEHKVVYLFYLLPVYKEGSMLCVVDPLQSPHNEPPGHAGVQDQVVWTSSP